MLYVQGLLVKRARTEREKRAAATRDDEVELGTEREPERMRTGTL